MNFTGWMYVLHAMYDYGCFDWLCAVYAKLQCSLFVESYLGECKKPFVCALMSRFMFHSMGQTHAIAKPIDDKSIDLSFQRTVNRWMANHMVDFIWCAFSLARPFFFFLNCCAWYWNLVAIVAEIAIHFTISLRSECAVAYAILSFFIRTLKMVTML